MSSASQAAQNAPFSETLDDRALDVLFRKARTHNAWQNRDVPDAVLHQIYNLTKMGPTSANCSPLRIVYVKSPAAKEKLLACLDKGNIDKTKSAPVTAILAYDVQFYELLPQLFPHTDAKSWFAGNDALIQETAFRNSSIQGAYFMLAARSLGLDCGAMSGFDKKKCDAAFFPDGRFKSNFLCNIGYGDASKLFQQSPRLSFDQACKIA